jgi:hypothetical protein
MKIEERLNRLEVNKMHITHLLEEILHHIPKKPEEHIEKKCPPDEEDKWNYARYLLKLERNTNHYAVDRERVTSLCYELYNHSEATEQNKEALKSCSQQHTTWQGVIKNTIHLKVFLTYTSGAWQP